MRPDNMERVLELLTELVADVDIDGKTLEDITQELETIYSNEFFRHSYAVLSDEMGNLKPDQRDLLCQRVDEVLGKIEQKNGEHSATTTKIGKLCDHINLECLRISRIERVEFIGEQSQKDLTQAGSNLVQTKEIVKDLENDVSGFHTQSITILGIFAGLVITFASVTQLITAGITNLTNVDAYKIVLFISVSFFSLFNIIFFMMYSVAKISGKSIASRCEKRRCSDCNACKWSIKKIYKKYPFFLWTNIMTIAICAASYLLNVKL